MAKKMFALIMAFGALLLLCLTLVITSISSRSLYRQTNALLQTQNNQTLNMFEQHMQNLTNIAFTTGNQPGIRSLMEASETDYQQYIVDSYGYVQQIDDIYEWVDLYLFATNSRYVMSSKEGNVSNNIDIAQSPKTKWYHQAKDSFANILLVSDFTPPVTGIQDAFAIVLTLRKAPDWSIGGFIAVSLDKIALDRLLENTGLQEPGFLVILDAEGTPVYSSNPGLTSHDTSMIPGIAYFKERPDMFSDDSFKDYYMVSTKSVFGDLRFVSFYDKRYLYRDVLQLQFAVFLLVLGSLLLLLAGAQILSRRVVNPIAKLIAFIHRAEESEFSRKLNIEAEDEVGQLVRSFNAMIDSVREHQILRRNAEFDALQKQIDPHFLYNTLESVKALARRSNVNELCRTIDCLGDLFRYNTNRSNRLEALIEEEVVHISNYLHIQETRFGSRLRYRIRVSDSVLRLATIRFILQPLVENAVRHGMGAMENGFVLLVRGREDGDSSVVFEVVDNGPGIPEDRLHAIRDALSGDDARASAACPGIGVGLRNIAERLRLLYGAPYGLNIESRFGCYTKVTVRIPKTPWREG